MEPIKIGQGPDAIEAAVFASPEDMATALAQTVLGGVQAAVGREYVLGCPGGRTPMLSYQAIGRQAAAHGIDLSHVRIAMMDEYLVEDADARLVYCAEDAHYSCRRAAAEDIAGVMSRDLPAARRIPPTQVWFPDPADPPAFDGRLREAGGIDLFLTASGASDGHVAFNTPGSALDCHSRVVTLPDSTRRDNLLTFPLFRGLDEVPRHGVTVGLGTIRSLSRQVILLIHGAGKREAVRRLDACGGFDPDWPASFIFACPQARILLDREALS